MIDLSDRWAEPGLALLAGWSLRWGLLLGALALWFALKRPRRAVTRHLLCTVALVAGTALPLLPSWWAVPVPWPARRAVGAVVAPVSARGELPSNGDLDGSASAVVPQISKKQGSQRARSMPPVPPREAFGRWRVMILSLAAIWLASVVVLVSRLVGGWLLLARLRATSGPVGESGERLLGECRRVLALTRPVTMGVHPSVASPVAIGGFPPLVVVPPDWNGWPEPDQRACLLHELTHLARRDDWAKLAQELVRVPFFFHPLVRWVVHRLDRERELLCDEAVVRLGADSIGYARLLLDLSRRPGRLLPAADVLRRGWLPFFDRGTVAVRIERLLEDDMTRPLPHPSGRRMLALGAFAFAAALGIGGLHVRAVEPPETVTGSAAAPPAKAEPPDRGTRKIEGSVLRSDDTPVAGAAIVIRFKGERERSRQVIETDKAGRFSATVPEGPASLDVAAYKEGLAPMTQSRWLAHEVRDANIEMKLGDIEPFSATLIDGAGRALAGAKIRVEMIGHGRVSGSNGVGASFMYVYPEVVKDTPLERAFETTTDQNGSFTLSATRPGASLRLGVTSAGGGPMRVRAEKPATDRVTAVLSESGFVAAPPGQSTRLVALTAARIVGRVVTTIPGRSVAGLRVWFQASRSLSAPFGNSNIDARDTVTDKDGRFVIDGLDDGTVNVFVSGDGENESWTYRAAKDVDLKSGVTADVTINLIRGVEVNGKVVIQGTGAPVEGAGIGVYGPYRPRSGAATHGVTTDAQGRYRYRLPPGETYLYVMGTPRGFARLMGKGSDQTVTIPEGVSRYEPPPLELASAVVVGGRVLDAAGSPVVGAKVIGTCEGGRCLAFPGTETVTDQRGAFRLPPGLNNVAPIGKAATLLIRLRDGQEFEAVAVPTAQGEFTARLSAVVAAPNGVQGPREVAPDELAGIVVDAQGKPLEGVEAHAQFWVPGRMSYTDRQGRFRVKNLRAGSSWQVRFRKEGYETQFHLDRLPGQPGWVVVLGNSTYFEGRVLDPGGNPVPEASIRANGGPKRASGVLLTETYTDAKGDADGRYRLHVEPGEYDIEVRVPGVGAAGVVGQSIAADKVKPLDLHLAAGIRFVALLIDHETSEPVPGIKLTHWQKPGIEGTSDAAGRIEIRDVPPGKYPRFQVEAKGYARWWSPACLNERSRYHKPTPKGFQRNFDDLDFEIGPGSKAVMISLERAATVTGRVLDPDGKPVAGATVAPALTGTGNSLTGDTRFSIMTDSDGAFTMSLPASGDRDYNLVAHDGKYGQWRIWANGVLPPFRTLPGREIRDVEIRLSRPATVHGRIVDTRGKPVIGREVHATAGDRLENRYYDPTTKTDADGTYELKFIRPGVQLIQVGPFWLDANHAPVGTSVTVELEPGQRKQGVDFSIPPDPREN